MAESKVAHENYLKQRKDESHKEKTELMAIKSRHRVDGWLQEKVAPAVSDRKSSLQGLADAKVEKMLIGLYKSSNPNLHDFRPPAGKLAKIEGYSENKASEGKSLLLG